jgi:pyruvate/2-oxoglutarate dehydrogenase complex dihydrolipoamide dehydrogenase (E3) component
MASPQVSDPQTIAPHDGDAAAVLPLDAHDRRLVANVHPADWRNPEPRGRYHLVVLGAGTGGLVTAAIGAALGARVALVERHLMGGDCLNVGCVPSKAMIRSARAWAEAREAAPRFGGPRAEGGGRFEEVMERMRRLRADLSPVDSAARFRELGVDVFLGEGAFTGPDALEVAGRTLSFRRAVIATGGRAAVPDVPGLAEAGYYTNETIFTLTEQPRRLAIVGAGPIGCEMAQTFARFGSEVTVLDGHDRPLTNDDPDAAAVVRAALERDGVRFAFGVKLTAAARDGEARVLRYTSGAGAASVTADAILVAAGRVPNVEGAGLEAAGVRFGRQGVEVDDRLRTSNPRIYAVGDIASRFRFTHAADALARIVVPNALFWGRGKASSLVMPWATYTSPEVAHVGISPADVASRGPAVETITVPLAEVDRARLDDATEGFFRVHLAAGTDTILGATLVAEHAGEVISQVTLAMTQKRGLGALGSMIYPYPTQAEVLRKAADAWRRRKLTPTAKRAFAAFFRAVR